MATEQYANRAADALASGISNVDVSLTLIDGSEFPSTGAFRIVIENEIILVGARSSNTLSSLTRGAEGTTAAAHSGGAAVTHVLTRDGLQALGTVLHARDTYANLNAAALREGVVGFPTNGYELLRHGAASKEHWGPIYPLAAPVDGDFAWVNQGGASVVTAPGGIFLSAPAVASNLRCRVKTAPATPYVLDIGFIPQHPALNFTNMGPIWRDTGTGRVVAFSIGFNSVPVITLEQWSNPTTTFGAYTISPAAPRWDYFYRGGMVWMRIADDGTNRTCHMSADGTNWLQIHTTTHTNFLTPNQLGFYVNAENTSFAAGMLLLHWRES